MNPFNLGLRNLLGVLLPGALLVLALLGCFAVLLPDVRPLLAKSLTEKTALVAAAVFLVSYVVGSVIRLYAADTVDRISAWLCRLGIKPSLDKPGTVTEQLQQLLAEVSDPSVSCPQARDIARWAWTHDTFPYPVWEWMKFRLYHPPEMLAFYGTYRHCFATGDRLGKEFFNYCKTVVFSANEGKRHAMAEEVQAAEANVRFFAGTFWAGVLSSSALLATSIILTFDKNPPKGTIPASIAVALLMALVSFAIVAGGRFRLLRLKEVDTVFDAFYLVHRHAIQCSQCNRSVASRPYDERQGLVEDAFSTGMSLRQLVALMKVRSHNNPMLSSLYFAGADRDHPYFLHTDRVAAGISVLPEDEHKSLVAKRHPHQNEVIVVLEGELHLDILTNGSWRRTDLGVGQVKVIAPGECHKIVSKDNKNSVFLFIKTRPAEEPRGELCSEG